jgi:citrate lyase subunit beta-like protein
LKIVLTSPYLEGIVIPKVDSAFEVQEVERMVQEFSLPGANVRLLASIESPLAIMNLKEVSLIGRRRGERILILGMLLDR